MSSEVETETQSDNEDKCVCGQCEDITDDEYDNDPDSELSDDDWDNCRTYWTYFVYIHHMTKK